jgi:hypothetical protein
MKLNKIKTRKAQATPTFMNVLVILLIVLAIFFSAFSFWSNNIQSAGLTLDSQYSSVNANLNAAQNTLDNEVEKIKDAGTGITEAESTAFAVWNGMKGIGSTIKLFVSFITVTLTIYTSILFPTIVSDATAQIFIALAFIGFTGFIAFLLIKVLKGEPNL